MNEKRAISRTVPKLALSKTEAASALGVSIDFFDEHVAPELCIVRRGRRRLIPVRELENWLDRSAEHVAFNKSCRLT